jgi:amidase
MKRRAFLSRAGGAAAAASLPGGMLRASATEPPAAVPGPEAAHGASEFSEISLMELHEGLRNGRWTSHGLTQHYLDAIARLDRAGPEINAILEVNPDALAIASAMDAEWEERGPRGPLHGIPVLLKDNIGTADHMHTSAGSLALSTSIAPHDAHLVSRLRAAGCVILGKANMSEWAAARGRTSTAGWSGRGRLTRNPYALDRSAGGSSSGTAAAVTANLAPVAVGTETLQSIVSPSSMCGIVGLKPTVGLVSRAGVIPVSRTQDSPGPMARSVRDVALLLNALVGPDPDDPLTANTASHADADYTRHLDPDGLRGARIGVARSLFGYNLLSDRIIERALLSLQAAGAILVDPVELPAAETVWSFDAEVLSYELKAGLDEYLASLGPDAPVKSLAELIAHNLRNRDRELVWFGQETFEYAQTRGTLRNPEYQRLLVLVRQMARTNGIDAALSRHRLDALVAPTQSPAWLSDILLGDNSMLGSFVLPAAAGYPCISVPAGDIAGLPVGMLFIGGAWSEATLLRLAFAFEQATRARRVPSFEPSILVRP